MTGDRIEVEAAAQTEYRADGNPKEYQITLFARDGLNNRKPAAVFSSKKRAKEEARQIAKENPGGKLVKTMREQRKHLKYGEDEEHPVDMKRVNQIQG